MHWHLGGGDDVESIPCKKYHTKALTLIHAENVIMTQDAALHINPKTMNATRLNGLRINTKLPEFIPRNRQHRTIQQ